MPLSTSIRLTIVFILLLQAKLQEFLGRRELDRHLDADEAIGLGASLHAANLSDGIKLNRKLGMIDGSTYAFKLEIDGPDYVKDESIDQVLVPRMKKMPIKVSNFISFCHQTVGKFSIWYVTRYICSILISLCYLQMFRSIRHTKDFDVSLNYDKAYELPPGASSHKFAEYSVSGLTDASEKLVNHNSLNCRCISFR
jgi:hypoxia up-regulated 1